VTEADSKIGSNHTSKIKFHNPNVKRTESQGKNLKNGLLPEITQRKGTENSFFGFKKNTLSNF
jgi:hypothetical protein